MFHTAVCDRLNIRYPILQGAMQGGGGVELVAAVSNAGGLGVLPTFGGTEEKLRKDIEGVKARTDKPFGVNITAMGRGFTETRANIIIETNVSVCTTGRADPGEKAVRMLKDAGVKVVSVIQQSNLQDAWKMKVPTPLWHRAPRPAAMSVPSPQCLWCRWWSMPSAYP